MAMTDHLDNVYQWIVEMHSFSESFPLVSGMWSKSPHAWPAGVADEWQCQPPRQRLPVDRRDAFLPRVPPTGLDMRYKSLPIRGIGFEIRFGQQYPMTRRLPPSSRPTSSPSQSGGGNVTKRGAMCMELLSNSGWCAVCTVESSPISAWNPLWPTVWAKQSSTIPRLSPRPQAPLRRVRPQRRNGRSWDAHCAWRC